MYNFSCKVFFLAVIFSFGKITAQPFKKPNIICIVADDLGYSDLGCYGGEIKTPSLDKLANEGSRLKNMHNGSMCVLSRSMLLSGKWAPKAGNGIKLGTKTLADELKNVGYRTGIVGKWHLQGEPNNRGFDYFFGFLGGVSSYYSGSKDYRLNQIPFTDFGKDYYSTDAFTEKAIEFIQPNNSDKNKPFFLYLSYQSPHNPLQAPKADIMKYRGKYLAGWQATRDARIKKQVQLGIIKEGQALPAYPQNLPDWSTLSPEQRDLEDLRMSVYAAMVEKMDSGIGKLLESLKKTGQLENTFILFLSDNGSDSFSAADAAMIQKGLLPGDPESNYQPGTGWAYTNVTPWRLYKISQHSGGVKTGAILWYPRQIKDGGTIRTNALHVVDIMPTIMEVATGEKLKLENLSGESFLPLISGKKLKRKNPMFFQFVDNRAIRTNKWSMVEVDGNGWELYKNSDEMETNDVVKQFPNVVSDLDKTWMNWWKTEGNNTSYEPVSTGTGPHYKPQGDRGTGKKYVPTAMPVELSKKYK